MFECWDLSIKRGGEDAESSPFEQPKNKPHMLRCHSCPIEAGVRG